MADSFDAYHVWLGIPPYDQPPNHYRLLGLEAFEENADAIANSAARQIAHIKSVAPGENADRGKQLLQEVAEARTVLLHADRKRAYDTKLRADFRQYDIADDVPLSDPLGDLTDEDIRGRKTLLTNAQDELWNEKHNSQQQQVNYIYAIGGTLAVVIALALLIPIAFRLGGDDKEKTELAGLNESNGEGAAVVGSHAGTNGAGLGGTTGTPNLGGDVVVGKPEAPDGSAAPKNASTSNAKPPKTIPPSATGLSPGAGLSGGVGGFNPGAGLGSAGGLSQGQQRNTPGALGGAPPANTPGLGGAPGLGGNVPGAIGGTPPVNRPSDQEIDPEDAAKRKEMLLRIQRLRSGYAPQSQAGTPQVGTPQKNSTKSPAPTPAQLATATEEIKTVYKDELAKNGTVVERAQLANFLYSQLPTAGKDATAKYALLIMSQDFAVKSGQVKLAFECLDRIVQGYTIEATEAKRALVMRLADRKSMPNDQRKLLVINAVQSYKELKQDKKHAEALEVARAARSHALTAKDAALRVKAQKIFAESNAMARMKKEHDEALTVLAETPDDLDANRKAGIYLCLMADNWPKGLPFLVKSKPKLLVAAAKLELTDPQNAEDKAKLGDAWKAAAELKGNEMFRSRAMHWYTEAAPDLTGLARTALDRKMREIRDADL